MPDTSGTTEPPLAHFESRLLDELKLLVERGSGRLAEENARRRAFRPRYVLLLAAVAALAAIAVASVGAWRMFAADPGKRAIVAKLESGRNLDRLVASDGYWSLYVQRRAGRLVDWELSSRDERAVGAFLGDAPIEVAGTGPGPGGPVLLGRVNAREAASVTIVSRDGRRLTVRLHDTFFLAHLRRADFAPATVVARDENGDVVARRRAPQLP